MELGLTLTLASGAAKRGPLVRLATLADEAGMDAIWVGDHIVFPPELPTDYPYSRTGTFAHPPEGGWLDALGTLSYLAAIAPRPTLGISVLVVPYRNPVVMSKLVATLDVLSEGRVILGAGVGWLRDEFVALAANFEDRGAVTDEYLEVYKALCRDTPSSFSGAHYELPEVVFLPKPVQRPWPPIWIGGNTGPALRRAARLGDNWQPAGLTPDEVPAARERLRVACERANRDPAEVGFSLRCYFHITDGVRVSLDQDLGTHGELVGPARAVRDTMMRYSEAGVDHMVFAPTMRSHEVAYVEQTERFVDAVATELAR